MTVRTTSSLVKGVIKVADADDLTPYIETANSVVNANCLASDYTDATLELIERWLSAHFYACDHPRSRTDSVGGAVSREKYDFRTDLSLNNTVYGQQAIAIDYAGNLAGLVNAQAVVKVSLQAGKKTAVFWLGTPNC